MKFSRLQQITRICRKLGKVWLSTPDKALGEILYLTRETTDEKLETALDEVLGRKEST